MGVVPQEPVLFDGSVYENIKFGRPPPFNFGIESPSDDEIYKAARLAGILVPPRPRMITRTSEEFEEEGGGGGGGEEEEEEEEEDTWKESIGKGAEHGKGTRGFNIWTQVGEQGQSISGGQKQRVAIARLALARPRIALLDEISSALDVRTEREIDSRLREVMKEGTILLVTHTLNNTLMSCDRVAVLEKGEVVEWGTPQELMTQSGSYLREMKED